MKVFINYADGRFYQSQMHACQSAKTHGFDEIIPYNKNSIDKEFYTEYEKILSQPRGAGYWLWKPYFILETLNRMSDGDYLFYCDSGALLINNISYLIDDLERSGQDIMPFDLHQMPERNWTKRDVFVFNECDTTEFTDTNICDAAFQLIKKSQFSMDFYMNYLLQGCIENLITDSPNVYGLPNYPEFIDHRHDQSIYSINIKKNNLVRFRTPSQYGLGVEVFYKNSNYPQIVHHHRNHI